QAHCRGIGRQRTRRPADRSGRSLWRAAGGRAAAVPGGAADAAGARVRYPAPGRRRTGQLRDVRRGQQRRPGGGDPPDPARAEDLAAGGTAQVAHRAGGRAAAALPAGCEKPRPAAATDHAMTGTALARMAAMKSPPGIARRLALSLALLFAALPAFPQTPGYSIEIVVFRNGSDAGAMEAGMAR